MLRNFLYAITKMVESEYRILILVVMKECSVAFVQTGKCCHVHANIFLQFSKKKKRKKMGLEFFISTVSKIAIFNFGWKLWNQKRNRKSKHKGDNTKRNKITENEVGSTESCVVEELPSRKTAIKSKVDEDTFQKLLRSILA